MPLFFCRLFFFFFPATKWKNYAIVPRGHWALNTMTTNCDPMRCSHADHACYPSTLWQLTVIQWGVHMLITGVILMMIDDWRCHAQTGPGHMTNHSLVSCFVFQRNWLRSPGALWRKRAKYLQTHIQVVLTVANPHWKMLLSGNFRPVESRTLESHESLECLVC